MTDKRPEPDRLLVAKLYGEARFRARWEDLGGEEHAAAVAALRDLAGGRGDLLAEVAGILEGASEGDLEEPPARQAARLCRAAGADPEAIGAWTEEGRRRAANASQPPFSGGIRALTVVIVRVGVSLTADMVFGGGGERSGLVHLPPATTGRMAAQRPAIGAVELPSSTSKPRPASRPRHRRQGLRSSAVRL